MTSNTGELVQNGHTRVFRRLLPIWLVIGALLFFAADATVEKLFVLAFIPWIGWLLFGVVIFSLALRDGYLLARRAERLQALMTILAVPLGASVLAFTAPFLARTGEKTICCAHPADEALIRRFDANRPMFDELVAMSLADARVIRIAPDFTRLDNNWAWPRPDSMLGFSKDRWQEYRRRFDALGLRAGLERGEGSSPKIFLLASTRGLVTGGSTKGYVYSQQPLTPLYPSLDTEPAGIQSNVPIYRHLSGAWYLFYTWDD